ncbi:hypothetical protein [Ferrimonas gelatinilytica]|uniref:DoxX-like family protein n=1 Tax=Ferrimonas gelatinilytica TaxID=1255257 RepID=A0ABP9S4G6_9GAMM
MTALREHPPAPWHLWLVAILAIAWNAMGALDYYLTQSGDAEYLSAFTPEQVAFFTGFPAWVDASWAVAVWGGLLGALLLLLRKSLAVPVLLISLLAMVLTTIHNYLLMDGLQVMGDPFSLTFTLVIFLVALFLLRYANRQRRNGVLR